MKPGEVILVRFPFTNLLTTKKRPALVLCRTVHSPRIQLVTLAMITSKVEASRLPGDLILQDWSVAGLLHPSLVRLAKVATIDHTLVEKSLGKCSKRDLEAARKLFHTLFAFWI